ncbi:SPRY domain containing protein [Acanthamoeba castellanii str. Neff]|uniref:SPRY domain containing protein n=1 Tax=Acanthamoeba castellanii (strain ATCC 30010 / Neff) TaxID=1257118 RepID=L8H9J6_ACACF|nr:SPRY domain containing protein [Acanthamoeba castellanii str. Neff]ELR21081.1 SPRY domain containing protein [Acanthamoeba castellanii str. Neff]
MNGEVDWAALYVQRKRQFDRVGTIRLSPQDVLPDLLEISDDGLSVRCTDCAVSYFEVHIENAGDVGPAGWRKGSYGYHADDGRVFAQSGIGRKWGPTFTTGDVIGCGVNFLSRSLFFTKNGELLGVAVQKLKHCRKFYPIVTLHSAGARVRLNFGDRPFVFPVGEHIRQIDEAFKESERLEEREKNELERKRRRGSLEASGNGAKKSDEEDEDQSHKADEESDDEDEDEDEEDEDDEGGEGAIASNWEGTTDDTFADILERITHEGADTDEELIEPYFRMENIDVDTIPVEELFEMTRELAIYIRESHAESSTWDLAPNVFRPVLTENDYRLVLADLRLLRNMAAYSTASPAIQAVLAYYSSAAQSTPHIGVTRWQAFTDAEKRRCLILALEAICRDYELCVCRRDVAILKSTKIADTNEQKQITIERVRERMTPLVHPPPAVLQQSDKEIAIWTLKEFERQLEASQLAIIEQTRKLVGVKYWWESLGESLGMVARRERTVASPHLRTSPVMCLLGTGYHLWFAARRLLSPLAAEAAPAPAPDPTSAPAHPAHPAHPAPAAASPQPPHDDPPA